MAKKLFICLLSIILAFSVMLSSLVVFADEPVGDEPGETEGSETTGTEGEGSEGGESSEETGTNGPAPNNNGASESLEGFKLVSPDDDANENLDLYFNQEEIAFKIAQKNSAGEIVKVWSSQLLPSDLGLSKDLSLEEKKNVYAYDRRSMSLLVIDYVNLGNTVNPKEITTTSYEEEHFIVDEAVTMTGKGVSFKISFPRLNIIIPICVEVDGQELNVRIPKDGFFENLEGAEEVLEADEEMNRLIDEINTMIVRVKKYFKDRDEKKYVENRFSGVTQNLDTIKEYVMTGSENRTVTPQDIINAITTIERDFERREYFSTYEGLKEDTEEIAKLVDECMAAYNIIASEVTYGVYSLEVMPFLGAGTITEEGYAFYPDGAGAISYFNVTHPSLTGYYSQAIYMDHVFNLQYMYESDTVSWNPALYPVFGVNKGDYGFVAIITEGDCDASIEYWPGNKDYVLGRVYSIFMYRHKSKYIRDSATYDMYETERLDYDRNIKYVFLQGEDAEYSGMANAYREYLKENDLINDAIADGEEIPLAVDFLAGVKEQGVLWETTIDMTTYQQIKDTLERLRQDGIKGKIYSNIHGWTKANYNPDPLNADGALGGKNDLMDLTEYAKENNIILGLAFNPVFATKQYATGEQVNKYMVRDSIGMLVNYEERRYVFSPKYIQELYAEKLIEKIGSYGANAAQINSIGYYLYYDYSNVYGFTSRVDTAKAFSEVARISNEKLGYSSIANGNMYMWKYATRIDEMPLSDLEYLFSDMSVPFLQMVLHGSIAYSGSYPYNVMYDDKKQMLEYIEFGCMPYFFLTQRSMGDMAFSNATYSYDWLYSSDIGTWYDDVIEVYNEFNDNVGYLWSQEIVKHNQLSDGIKRVEYTDGSVIYINYNETEAEFTDPYSNETVKVDAQSYIVRKGAA